MTPAAPTLPTGSGVRRVRRANDGPASSTMMWHFIASLTVVPPVLLPGIVVRKLLPETYCDVELLRSGAVADPAVSEPEAVYSIFQAR